MYSSDLIGVKICGVRDERIMAAALDAGADFVGLVFFAKSPRNIDIAHAAVLAAQARGRAEVVALTVDADDATLSAIVDAVGPDIVQMHGGEPPSRCAEVAERFDVQVLKAVGVAARADVMAALDYVHAGIAVLFDAKAPQGARRPGGNGQPFDWSIIGDAPIRAPFMLSGGLTPVNVAEAIRVTRAAAVDVSSGVETFPGVKDARLIQEFVKSVRAVEPS